MELQWVRAGDHVNAISDILQAAWQPPAIDYFPAYVRWELGFPESPGMAVLASEGGTPAAFVAALPRRFLVAGQVREFHLVSFFSVRRSVQGVAGVMVARELFTTLRKQGAWLVSFGKVGSRGEQTTTALYRACGYRVHPLPTSPSYAYIARGERGNPDYVVEETRDTAAFARWLESSAAEDELSYCPSASQLEHYLADPRDRALLFVRRSGTCVGAAMAIHGALRTEAGHKRVPTLDSIFLRDRSADALRALLDFVAVRYASGQNVAVAAPNLPGISAEAIADTDLLTIAAGFTPHVCLPVADDRITSVKATNLEIV